MASLICNIDAQLSKMFASLVWDKFGSKKSEHWPPNLCVGLLQRNVGFLHAMACRMSFLHLDRLFLPEDFFSIGGDYAELNLARECCSQGSERAMG